MLAIKEMDYEIDATERHTRVGFAVFIISGIAVISGICTKGMVNNLKW